MPSTVTKGVWHTEKPVGTPRCPYGSPSARGRIGWPCRAKVVGRTLPPGPAPMCRVAHLAGLNRNPTDDASPSTAAKSRRIPSGVVEVRAMSSA